MSDSSRKTSNGAVEQIMRNMTKDINNSDGTYIQFTSSSTPPQDTWNIHPQPSYIPFNMHRQPEAAMPAYNMEQYPQSVPYNYIPQQPMYGNEHYEKHLPTQHDMNYVFPPASVPEFVFSSEYKSFLSKNMHNINMSEHAYMQPQPNGDYMQQEPMQQPPMQSRSPLIDNVVGNWTPTTSGTYSPFGNTSSFNTSNIFEQVQDMEYANNKPKQVVEPKANEKYVEFEPRTEEPPSFQFNRDTKKPRMVAEVKPMRPSYSDVLLKSVPPTTTMASSKIKLDNKDKEAKPNKKDAKKVVKQVKPNNSLNRSNTSNEIKDLGNDKVNNFKNSEKSVKDNKNNNLNRKWASLDNVADSYSDFKNELNDVKKPKPKVDGGLSAAVNKTQSKGSQKKILKNESSDADTTSTNKSDTLTNSKVTARKALKTPGRVKNHDNGFNNDSRSSGKRSQRARKKDSNVLFGVYGQKTWEYLSSWWKYIVKFFMWLFHLVADILSLSIHLSKDIGTNFYSWATINYVTFMESTVAIIKRIKVLTWIYEKFKKEPEKKPPISNSGLHNNINMPTTGEEAMKRLLACKGKDPYSILGVTPLCTDADIKNYYKKQAKLVHPDKNQQPGAEEAFKILVHAFNMIGEPERRAAYDRGVAESAQAEQAMTELTELLVQLQQKVEAAANTIRCSACGLRHKRVKVDRPIYAARNCASCKIHHSAREGDIWAEARCFGFLWYYFACMDGGVYDITEWAACQKDSLKHLKPDSHNVQYRIALGKQANTGPGRRQHQPANMSFPRTNDRNADLNSFINNLYGQTAGTDAAQAAGMRRKPKKTK